MGAHMGAHIGGHMGAHTPLQSTFVMHDGKIITLPLIYHTGYIYIYIYIVYHYLANTRTIKGAWSCNKQCFNIIVRSLLAQCECILTLQVRLMKLAPVRLCALSPVTSGCERVESVVGFIYLCRSGWFISGESISPQQAGWAHSAEVVRGASDAAQTPGKEGGHESGFHPCRCGREASELSGLPAGSRAADFTFLTRRPMLFRDRSWKILQGGSWGGKCDWIGGVHNFPIWP